MVVLLLRFGNKMARCCGVLCLFALNEMKRQRPDTKRTTCANRVYLQNTHSLPYGPGNNNTFAIYGLNTV